MRRDFHWRHRRMLWPAWLAIAAGWLVFSLGNVSGGLVIACLLLGLPVSLHLTHAQILRHSRHALLPKELFGGFMFAVGVGVVLLEAKGQLSRGPIDQGQAASWFAAGQGFQWWLRSTLFVLASVVSEPAVPVLGLLFSVNCFLVGWQESRDGRLVDDASAARHSPLLSRWSPLACAALAVSAAVNSALARDAGLSAIFLSVALSASLMLCVHQMARHRLVSTDLAALLLDVSLLAPWLLLACSSCR